MVFENEGKILRALFVEGLSILDEYSDLNASLPILAPHSTPKPDNERIEKFFRSHSRPKNMHNPDLFFSVLLGGIAHNFDPASSVMEGILSGLSASGYPKDFFSKMAERLPQNAALKAQFSANCDQYVALDDAALASAAKDQFDISYRNLLDTPPDQSIICTKINHGYWEHFLCVHAQSFEQRASAGFLRQLKRDDYVSRYSASGFDAALARTIERVLTPDSSSGSQRVTTRLSIGFCAGERLCARILGQPLKQESRGAIAGSLGFFSSLMGPRPIHLGDGSEAKSLVDNGQTTDFVDQQLRGAAALLYVVPPHLKNIEVSGADAEVYRLIIPGRFAHETWRACLPVFLATVRRIVQKHGQVTILTQSAVLAPLLGLVLAEVANRSGKYGSIRFFDLGRILDVAVPDVAAAQGWFKRHANNPSAAAHPFKLSAGADTHLRNLARQTLFW